LTEVNSVDVFRFISSRQAASQELAMKKIGFTFLMICVWSDAGQALDSEQRRGKALLGTLCGRCHAIGQSGRSAHVDAPPFRTLGDSKLYDNDFAARLEDGLSTIHPDMPTFRFSRADAEAAVNYLKSIQAHQQSK
jgi:mono/diheme cytochrome c family protein